jgi:PAS domain S-box-containing protein
MSIFTVINGIIIGALLLSAVFSFVLVLRRFEIKINFSYLFFSVALSLYILLTLQSYYITDYNQYVYYDKIITASIIVAGFFFIYLIAQLTGYSPKKIIFTLEFFLLVQLVLNFALPNGITFSEVTGKQNLIFIWGETVNYPKANTSAFLFVQVGFLVFVFSFIIRAIYFMYKSGDKENWKVLLFSLILTFLLIILNTFFEVYRYKGLSIFEKMGFLSFTLIVVHRNFKNLFYAGQLRTDLVKSEERLRSVLESTYDGVWEWNFANGEVNISARYAEMLGYTKEEFINNHLEWIRLVHPDDIGIVNQTIADLLQGIKIDFQIRSRLRTKNGNWKWVYTRGKVVEKDTDGKPVRVIGVQTDIDEHMGTQSQLEENKKRYKNLSDAAFEGLGITENGIIADCNMQFANMMGYSVESLIGKSYYDLVAPEFKNKIDTIFSKNNEVDSYEYLAIKNDGTVFPVEVNARNVELGGKNLRVTAIRDISYKKKHKEEILDRENTLREIIDSAPFGAQTFVLSAKGVLTLVGFNKYADSTLNIDHSKLVGKSITEAFPSLAISQAPAIYKRVATEGITYKDDQTIYDGGLIKGIFEVNAIRTGKNQVTVFFRDITEIKRSEELLRKNEEKFRLIAENSTDMISKHDSKGNFIYVSPSCKTLLGYEPNELIGKNPYEYFHKDDRAIIDSSRKNIPGDPEKTNVTVYRFKKKNGDFIWFETVSKSVRNTSGEIIEIHTSSRDVSERIRYQEELKENADNLNKIFDATPIPLILESLTPKIQVIYANDTACKFIGKEKKEIIGKMVVGGIPDQMNASRDESSIKEGDEYDFETSMLVNGKVKYAIVNIRIVNYNGSYCALSAIHDITDRKLAHDEKERSERKLSTAMQIAKLGHWEYDVFQKLFTLNDEFYKMMRTSLNELGNYKISPNDYAEKFIPQEDRYVIDNEIAKAIQATDQGYSSQIEHEVIFGDGTTGTISVRISIVKDDNGETVKLYGVNQDITERKIAEEESTRRKYLIDQLLENVPDVIYFKDVQSRFLEISESYSKRLQISSREEIIGKTDFDIFDEEHATEAFNDEMNIMKTGIPLISKVEKEMLYGKEERWQLTTKMPLKDSTGDIIGTFGISRDITESRKAEEELRDAMHYIEYVINSIPIAILSVDEEDNVTQYNQTAKIFLNQEVDPEEINLYKKFPELKMVNEFLEKSRKFKNLVTDAITIADEEGEAKMYSISIFPLTTSTNFGSVILVEDVTNRRKMEQVLIQSEKMLSVAGLAAGMAHEINNPLGTISQGCQNLVRRSSAMLPRNFEVAKRLGVEMETIESYFKERQLFEIMDSMQGAVEKASEIIKNMLQFSRRSESKKVQYSLKKIVEEVIDLAYNDYDLKKKFNFRSFKIVKEYEDSIPDVHITVTELQQVVYNILQNAAHAMRGEENSGKLPTLTFRLSREIKYVRLEIEDNGPGIKEKIKNRIFEPFFTTKEVGEGTGLGLSVSYMIVTHNHNGLLTVESIPGRGTKFIIQIPYLDKTCMI